MRRLLQASSRLGRRKQRHTCRLSCKRSCNVCSFSLPSSRAIELVFSKLSSSACLLSENRDVGHRNSSFAEINISEAVSERECDLAFGVFLESPSFEVRDSVRIFPSLDSIDAVVIVNRLFRLSLSLRPAKIVLDLLDFLTSDSD